MNLDTEYIFVPRKRRVHDRNLNSRLMSVRIGSCTYLDNDLTLTLLTSLLHHLGFIEPGIRMNFIFELHCGRPYWDAGMERVNLSEGTEPHKFHT